MEICTILLIVSGFASGLSYAEASVGPPFPMTPQEEAALQQFKKIVLPKIPASSIVSNYSRDDLYLMKWLSSSYLNVQKAEERFLKHLKWREEEKMDTINQEDWSEYTEEYPAFVDTFDKSGRPTGELWISEWDIRRGVLGGQERKLSRWVNRVFELNMRRLMRIRSEGKNVTMAVIIVDSEGFTFRQLCNSCNPVLIRYGAVWEHQYPDLLESSFGINLTPAFQSIIDGFQPLLRPETKRSLKTFRFKKDWLPVLDKRYDKSQRSYRFGGTKLRDV